MQQPPVSSTSEVRVSRQKQEGNRWTHTCTPEEGVGHGEDGGEGGGFQNMLVTSCHYDCLQTMAPYSIT